MENRITRTLMINRNGLNLGSSCQFGDARTVNSMDSVVQRIRHAHPQQRHQRWGGSARHGDPIAIPGSPVASWPIDQAEVLGFRVTNVRGAVPGVGCGPFRSSEDMAWSLKFDSKRKPAFGKRTEATGRGMSLEQRLETTIPRRAPASPRS